MAMIKRVMSTNYALDISVEKLLAIMDKDREAEDPLYMLLIGIDGVADVDYDGHFGPHIYVTLYIEYENEDMWKSIYETIENYL